jgi:hypothetical protein
LTLIRLKFCSKRGFLHVSKQFKKFYLLFYVKKTITECPVPLDISIKSNRNTIKQFYIVNLTKTWLGDLLGNFSLSLGNFFTKTSGHPVNYFDLFQLFAVFSLPVAGLEPLTSG